VPEGHRLSIVIPWMEAFRLKMQKTRQVRRSAFRSEEADLRAIVREFGPVSEGMPDDEYDCLVHCMLSCLHRGASRDGLAQAIDDHIREHLGLTGGLPGPDPLVDPVWTWWAGRGKSAGQTC
jgi:hypothetical protein